MAKIIIPTPLRKFTANQAWVHASGGTVIEALKEVTNIHPEVQTHLFDQHGKLRGFVRIFVGDQDINALQQEETKLNPDSVVSIIPAIAGGSTSLSSCT